MKRQKIKTHNLFRRSLSDGRREVFGTEDFAQAVTRFLTEQFGGACVVENRGVGDRFLLFRPYSAARVLSSVFRAVALRAPLLVSLSGDERLCEIAVSFPDSLSIDEAAVREWTLLAEDAGFSFFSERVGGLLRLSFSAKVHTFTATMRARAAMGDFYKVLQEVAAE